MVVSADDTALQQSGLILAAKRFQTVHNGVDLSLCGLVGGFRNKEREGVGDRMAKNNHGQTEIGKQTGSFWTWPHPKTGQKIIKQAGLLGPKDPVALGR